MRFLASGRLLDRPGPVKSLYTHLGARRVRHPILPLPSYPLFLWGAETAKIILWQLRQERPYQQTQQPSFPMCLLGILDEVFGIDQQTSPSASKSADIFAGYFT
jgi:hypothetical protein